MVTDLLARVCVEIDARLAELRPVLAEHERLLGAADALEAEAKAQAAKTQSPAKARSAAKARPAAKARSAAKTSTTAKTPTATAKTATAKTRATARGPAGAKGAARSRVRGQARMGAAEQAIVAALEHGSHTVGELGIVTAMPGPEIRESLRRLQRGGKIAPTRREGRAAYALSSTAAG